MAPAPTVTVRVSSRPEKFRRAGFDFTREAREVEVDAKTLAALEEEPLLAVERVPAPQGKGKASDDSTGKKDGGGGKGS